MNERHDKFVKRLFGSRAAVFRVAEWLNTAGYAVMIPPIVARESHENPADFYDEGDLFRKKKGGEWERVEVKGSGYDFTDNNSWPYSTMIVSNKAAVDRGSGKVVAYVILSVNWEWVAIIKSDTREHWRVETIHAKNTDKYEDFYMCPADKVIFRQIKNGGSS
jgi:hypothetical protein